MYFDAHAHVQFAAFQDDWKEVIDRALAKNVWMINVGTQRDTSVHAIEVAHEYKEGAYATVGLHPIHTEQSYHDVKELGLPQTVADHTQTDTKIPRGSASSPRKSAPAGFTSRGEGFDYDYYKKLAQDPKVVAIGECGLDYYRLGAETKKRQQKTFLKHIELAKEVRKPLMIHCRETPSSPRGRNAFADLIELLSTHYLLLTNPPGIIHFFTGTPDDAKKLLDLGFSFTFGGVITFARDYDESINLIPLDRILSETDAPYVTPVPFRGKRNEPAYVVEVVKKLAELKRISTEEVERQIFINAKRIFHFPI